ncbi:MAG TPA: hypothetical protein VNZ86_12795 [Bacteroidia bacterium]|jgi:hypothetical protein|nr:hypothetical protein [Bacteroidia bacterium]
MTRLRYSALFLFLFLACSLQAQTKTTVKRTFSTIPGSDDYQVTLRITYENINGFGKLEEVLPAGAKALNPGPEKACTIRTDGNLLKFIWTAFPPEGEVVLTYRISFPPGTLFASSMHYSGTFRYVQDNMVMVVPVE